MHLFCLFPRGMEHNISPFSHLRQAAVSLGLCAESYSLLTAGGHLASCAFDPFDIFSMYRGYNRYICTYIV